MKRHYGSPKTKLRLFQRQNAKERNRGVDATAQNLSNVGTQQQRQIFYSKPRPGGTGAAAGKSAQGKEVAAPSLSAAPRQHLLGSASKDESQFQFWPPTCSIYIQPRSAHPWLHFQQLQAASPFPTLRQAHGKLLALEHPLVK